MNIFKFVEYVYESTNKATSSGYKRLNCDLINYSYTYEVGFGISVFRQYSNMEELNEGIQKLIIGLEHVGYKKTNEGFYDDSEEKNILKMFADEEKKHKDREAKEEKETKEYKDLKALHLEEMVVLPEDYKERLKASYKKYNTFTYYSNGFLRDRWKMGGMYHFYTKTIGPFVIRVTDKNEDTDAPEIEGSLYYTVKFAAEHKDFSPFAALIKKWGKKHKGEEAFNYYFGAWLLQYIDDSDPADDYFVYVHTPVSSHFNEDKVLFQVEGEKNFYRLLTELSNGFRALAAK
jgi:hypothetical protein